MKQILIGLIPVIGVPLIMWLWNCFLSRAGSVIFGWRFAALTGGFLKQKLGPESGGKVEGRFATTLDDFSYGIRVWLKGDPCPTKESLKGAKTNGSGAEI